MFEGLDAIDWDNIWHGHGSASLFPFWIRALTSHDDALAKQAIEELRYITHQGFLSPAARYPIPFLIELLSRPVAPHRDAILALLVDVAEAATICIDMHYEVPLNGRIPAADLPDAHPEREPYIVLDRVTQGIDIYETLLSDGDSEVRLQATCLLGRISPRADEIRPRLLERMVRERIDRIQAMLLTSLVHLSPHHPDNREILERYARTCSSELVQLVVSLLVAQIELTEIPDDIADFLVHILDSPGEALRLQYWDLVPYRYDLLNDLKRALRQIGPIKAYRALPVLLRMLAETKSIQALHLAELVLFIIFPEIHDGEKIQPAKLTIEQRATLVTIFSNPVIWRKKGPWHGRKTLWEIYGLPETQEEFQRFLL